jgi:SsrA-binding protein
MACGRLSYGNMSKHEDEILMTNKRAKFDYEILGTFQAGLSLSGGLVKQVRARRVNLQGKYIVFQQNQLQILAFGNDRISENVAILVTKKEKDKVAGQLSTKGVSCIPLNLKKVGRWLKADIALVKGKKNYDKRESIKKRDLDRDYRKGIV